MLRAVASISTLLLGMAILLSGSGLLGIVLALRASNEGFSQFTIGLIMASFYVGYIVGAILCPRLIHRVGHIRAFTAFAAGCAALSLAYGLSVHPVAWLVLRFINGVALIGIYMVIESWINERAHQDRAQVFSVYMMVNLTALAIGQSLILFNGSMGLGSFAVAAMLFAIGLLPIALTPVIQPTPIRTERLRLSRLFAVAPAGFMGVLGSGLIGGSFWSFAAIYARSIGMSDMQAAGFIVACIVGGAVLQWPIGWLSDKVDRRLVLLGVSAGTMMSVSSLALASHGSTLSIYAIAVLLGGFLFSIYGLAVAQTHDRFNAAEVLEATKGMLMVHGIGSAIGPIVTGAAMVLLADGFPVMVAGMALLLGGFTAVSLLRDAPVPDADKTVFAPMETVSPVAMDLDPRSPDPQPLQAADAHIVADTLSGIVDETPSVTADIETSVVQSPLQPAEAVARPGDDGADSAPGSRNAERELATLA